jgi:hypothetical protein
MAYYAFLDENNIVTEVISGIDETELIEGLSPEEWYGNFRGQRCLRTSYNNNIRVRYAGIGMTYREDLDAFIERQPFPSWVLNESTCSWEPPISKPPTSPTVGYLWNEETISWDFVDKTKL